MACDRLDCTTCHPPAPEPLPVSRPGWARSPTHPRQWYRELVGVRLCAIAPTAGDADMGAWWTLPGGPGGFVPTLADAQLACERAAVPMLRKALAMLEAEQAGPAIYCEHGVAADCAVHRDCAAPWNEPLSAGPPGPMPSDGGMW